MIVGTSIPRGAQAWANRRRAGPAALIVGTSALLAILLREHDASRFEQFVATTPECRMSVANAFEASIVVEGRWGMEAGLELDAFIYTAAIEMAPVTVEHLFAARRAWRRFGKGNHRAALNFGDCFAYALAEAAAEPLLFKGNDLARTDIPAALLPEGDVRP